MASELGPDHGPTSNSPRESCKWLPKFEWKISPSRATRKRPRGNAPESVNPRTPTFLCFHSFAPSPSPHSFAPYSFAKSGSRRRFETAAQPPRSYQSRIIAEIHRYHIQNSHHLQFQFPGRSPACWSKRKNIPETSNAAVFLWSPPARFRRRSFPKLGKFCRYTHPHDALSDIGAAAVPAILAKNGAKIPETPYGKRDPRNQQPE